MVIDHFFSLLDPTRRAICVEIFSRYKDHFETLPGSRGKHQAWPGGLLDHVIEVMNIACLLHGVMETKRHLPFSLADALFVLFLHDHDKLKRYPSGGVAAEAGSGQCTADEVREELIREHAYTLSDAEYNALKYVHGEGQDYSPERRIMAVLAAFVHGCDTVSARIWHAHGQGEGVWASHLIAKAPAARDL